MQPAPARAAHRGHEPQEQPTGRQGVAREDRHCWRYTHIPFIDFWPTDACLCLLRLLARLFVCFSVVARFRAVRLIPLFFEARTSLISARHGLDFLLLLPPDKKIMARFESAILDLHAYEAEKIGGTYVRR